jgi:hypothetical protein
MKQTFYILIALGFWGCNTQPTEKNVEKKLADSVQTISVNKQREDFYFIDKSQYDKTFLDGLAEFNEPIELIDNYILTGTDTTYFPEDLILNKKTTFSAVNDSNKFYLTVTRTNLTNINYEFQLLDKDNRIIVSKLGKAILSSGFFLATESDIDTEMGGYGSNEYWDKSNNCWFSARIGIGKDGNGKQRAKLNYSCDDKNKEAINLDECPVLRTE